jgi:hypothetical protein
MSDTPVPPDDAPEPAPVRRTSWRSWAAASGVAVVVVVGGVLLTRHHSGGTAGTANAATSADGGAAGPARFADRGAAGKITSIKGTALTIDAIEPAGFDRGSGTTPATTTTAVKVTTGKATTYSALVKGSVRDLKAGDTVVVLGTADGATFSATAVSESDRAPGSSGPGAGGSGPARRFGGALRQGASGPDGRGGLAVGTIASVDGDHFTLTQRDGSSTTVTSTSDTTVTVTKAIAFKDLRVGDTILVTGDRSGDTVVATAIRKGGGDGALGFGFGGPGGFRGFGRREGTTSTTAAAS